VLEKGALKYSGGVEAGIAQYLESNSLTATTTRSWSEADAPGSDRVRLLRIAIRASDSSKSESIRVSDHFDLEIDYRNARDNSMLSLSVHFFAEGDVLAFATTTWQEPSFNGKPFPQGLFRSVCRIPAHLLNTGPYSLRIYFVENVSTVIAQIDDVFAFELDDSNHDRSDWHGKWPGALRPNLAWQTELLGR
jgi:lipopolysaccharide transport system ATP-binding protein